jgi:hypothetical protein
MFFKQKSAGQHSSLSSIQTDTANTFQYGRYLCSKEGYPEQCFQNMARESHIAQRVQTLANMPDPFPYTKS